MTAAPIRVFVVDDSAFVRRAVARVLGAEPRLRLVGEAATAAEALTRIPDAAPDLVTLDLEMPDGDGLELLHTLLQRRPSLRVLMLSAHTRAGAEATLEALEAGAVDFIDKGDFHLLDLERLRSELVPKLLAQSNGRRPLRELPARLATSSEAGNAADFDLCVIGASTGGPAAVQHILERLSGDFPVPIVVVQHMPPGFTRAFADRLDGLCRLTVREALDGDRLLPGLVLVAPAGRHLRISRTMTVTLGDDPPGPHVPSVDVTMLSAAAARNGRVLGVLLTGMGDDGAAGLAMIRSRGGVTLAESEESCVVYGMPRAAEARGAVNHLLPLPDIAEWLAAVRGD